MVAGRKPAVGEAVVDQGPVVADDDVEEGYKVEKLIDFKIIDGRESFQVRWEGFSPDEDTWEPAENLPGFEEDMKILRNREGAKRSGNAIKAVSPQILPTEQGGDGVKRKEETPGEVVDAGNEQTPTMSNLAERITMNLSDEEEAEENDNTSSSGGPSGTMVLPQLTNRRQTQSAASNRKEAAKPLRSAAVRARSEQPAAANPRGRKRTKVVPAENAANREDTGGDSSPGTQATAASLQRDQHSDSYPSGNNDYEPSEFLASRDSHSCPQRGARRSTNWFETEGNRDGFIMGVGDPRVIHVGAAPAKAKGTRWSLLQFPNGDEVYLPCDRVKKEFTQPLLDYLLERLRFVNDHGETIVGQN